MKYLPKNATADDNVNVVHTLAMCDRRQDLRSIDSEVGISFGGSKINPNWYLRYVEGFGRMGAANVDQSWSEKDSARYF